MYKFFLSLRYLRTRYVALASIISVTLGVATMIVVNSVMAGFREEMYQRLHGILSDIVVESHSLDGIGDPQAVTEAIRQALGEDLEGVTTTVHVPAMLSIPMSNGNWLPRQVNLIGIDDETYARVSDFSDYLLHPANRRRLTFQLHEDGYDDRIGNAGWRHRRLRVATERLYQEHLELVRQQADDPLPPDTRPQESGSPDAALDPTAGSLAGDPAGGSPARCPHCDHTLPASDEPGTDLASDPFLQAAEGQTGHVFDEMEEQHPGIVLGIATSNVRQRDADSNVVDYFLCKPGDDVRLTFPSAGTPPTAVSSVFTVVDFYESKMSEYDATFAFCPLSHLQQLRGMVDKRTGVGAVTSIQLKLRPGSDLIAARDQLRGMFPVEVFRYRIDTWKDLQGPLLAAVQWETTILNILLFLIIAVAGFGIFATFFMIVVEKTRDIGILKSLGAPSRGVMSIFLSYGVSLGAVGSGVGMLLGVVFVWNINHIADWIERLTHQEVFDPTVYYFQEIPTILSPLTVAWIVVGALVIAVLASVLPALHAARMHPVEALRHE
jgi:lipoprotein-releasing system permease protein